MKRCVLIVLLLLCIPLFSHAEEEVAQQRDSVEVSLLTCSAGSEVYAIFGHTAIRYQDFAHGIDYVFSYGVFSFHTPHFIYRFVKGETDYQMGVAPFRAFYREYHTQGMSVDEQVLNLTDEEQARLLALLNINYQPQNRTYRYNYFFDNCTTRARDKIEECLSDALCYDETFPRVTFRDILHLYTASSPWTSFGIDCCLGAAADRVVTFREWAFIPFHLQEAFGKAAIQRDTLRVPFVREERCAVELDPTTVVTPPSFPIHPTEMMWGVCCLFLLLAIIEWRRRCHWWGLDVACFAVEGIIGCVVAFLFFFSEHPSVGSNYLVTIFNPLPILWIPYLIRQAVKHRFDYGYPLFGALHLLFLLFWNVMPQEFHPALFPMVVTLLSRHVSYLITKPYTRR